MFQVLGYLLLVIIISYGYFGSLMSDLITNSNDSNKNQSLSNELKKEMTVNLENEDMFDSKILQKSKFYRTITSTELIVILWITLIYGTSLLLFLRFRILKLERDPNSDKHKKNKMDSTEELNAFLLANRKNKRSFKQKIVSNEEIVKDDCDQPFWKK